MHIMYNHRTADNHPQKLVNFPDCKGWTPLHYACYDSNKELVKQLLAAGADKCARYSCTVLVHVDRPKHIL